MSNDFFKVKKGLNIKPQDPSELSDLQDGDIIVDSTDDNKLKVYDSVGGDFASVGTGGSSGNILKDIEKLTPTVSNVVAVTDTATFLPIDDNNKSVKATFSGSDGSIRYEAAASADLDNVQGIVSVWIKTDLDNLTISSTKDGVVESSQVVSSSNKWRQYVIPTVLGDADYGFEISADGAVAGDVFIDEAFVKVAPEGYIQSINNVDTDWISYTPTFTGFGTVSGVDFEYKRVGDSMFIRGDFISGTATATTAQVSLPLSFVVGLQDQTNEQIVGLAQREVANSNNTYAVLATGGDSHLEFVQINNAGATGLTGTNASNLVGSGNRLSLEASVKIQGWSTGRTEVVNQQTELEEYEAILSSTVTTTGVISDLTINGLTIGKRYRVSMQAYLFHAASAGVVNVRVDNGSQVLMVLEDDGSNTTNSGTRYGNTSTFVATDTSVTVNALTADANDYILGNGTRGQTFIQVEEAPINKTIIGKFANINDTPLCQVLASGNTGQAITASTEDISFTNIEKDNCNIFNNNGNSGNRTDTITANRKTTYLVTGGLEATTEVDSWIVNVYKDGTFYKACGRNAKDESVNFSCIVEAEQGEDITFRSTDAFTEANTDRHFINITELPDQAAIVKNLAADQAIKCQTKSFNSSVTSTGIISDLTFTNIDLSKKYSLFGNIRVDDTSPGSNANISGSFTVTNIPSELTSSFSSRVSSVLRHRATPTVAYSYFTPTDSTIEFNVTSIASMQYTSGHMTLCQLNDFYTETDEW